MAVSPQKLAEYLMLLDEVNRLAQEELVAVWRVAGDLGTDEAWQYLLDAVPELVQGHRVLSVDLAAQFYEETQGIAFNSGLVAEAAPINKEQLQANIRYAMTKTATLGLIAGAVQKHIMDGGRTYGINEFTRMGQAWQRAARPDACAFCAMLATRAISYESPGWGPYTYASATTVGKGKHSRPKKMQEGDRFHDHCRCVPVLASKYKAPDYVQRWTDQYYAATDEVRSATDTRAILSKMREIGDFAH